ncbi:MAG TPA: hypothetical protein VGL81_10965 [Polyangiaceae bacterium]
MGTSLAACGGSTSELSGDSGAVDARGDSAPGDDLGDSAVPDVSAGDAGYLACMSASGQVDDSLETCQADTDCTLREEQTDCCGSILYVGINTASAAAFGACESAWVAHFPGCGCAPGASKTEDGKTVGFGSDASAPQVHCGDFTMSGGICLTYLP